ncbi:MAG TPA: acetoacetate decarboxylase family protein [Acidimicrobiales bacterium]|nr:acetoacetate decarboxylase family protein [Acidimicrobiales bacterium]
MGGSPSIAPLYPDPPYEYRRARMVTCLLDGAAPRDVLPAGLQLPETPSRAVVFADYPDTTIGPYREVVVLAGADRNGAPGMFCPLIYVDSDAALCAGREIWGFPKKLAHIHIEQDGDAVSARLVRDGVELLALRGTVEEQVDPAAVAALGALPLYNRKLIPGVAAKEPDVDRLTRVLLDIVPHEAATGTGVLQAAGEAAAVVGDLATVTVLAAVVDSVLPAGDDLR